LNENSGIGGKRGRSRTHQDTVTFKIGEGRPSATADENDNNNDQNTHAESSTAKIATQDRSAPDSAAGITLSSSAAAASSSSAAEAASPPDILVLHEALGAVLGNKATEIRAHLARCVRVYVCTCVRVYVFFVDVSMFHLL
jgi:hypothetical protein